MLEHKRITGNKEYSSQLNITITILTPSILCPFFLILLWEKNTSTEFFVHFSPFSLFFSFSLSLCLPFFYFFFLIVWDFLFLSFVLSSPLSLPTSMTIEFRLFFVKINFALFLLLLILSFLPSFIFNFSSYFFFSCSLSVLALIFSVCSFIFS